LCLPGPHVRRSHADLVIFSVCREITFSFFALSPPARPRHAGSPSYVTSWQPGAVLPLPSPTTPAPPPVLGLPANFSLMPSMLQALLFLIFLCHHQSLTPLNRCDNHWRCGFSEIKFPATPTKVNIFCTLSIPPLFPDASKALPPFPPCACHTWAPFHSAVLSRLFRVCGDFVGPPTFRPPSFPHPSAVLGPWDICASPLLVVVRPFSPSRFQPMFTSFSPLCLLPRCPLLVLFSSFPSFCGLTFRSL